MATDPTATAPTLAPADLVWGMQRTPGRSVLTASFPGGRAVMAVAGEDALTGPILWAVSTLDPELDIRPPYDLGLVDDLHQAERAVLASINAALSR